MWCCAWRITRCSRARRRSSPSWPPSCSSPATWTGSRRSPAQSRRRLENVPGLTPGAGALEKRRLRAILQQRLLVAGGRLEADGAVAFRCEDAALRRAGEVTFLDQKWLVNFLE